MGQEINYRLIPDDLSFRLDQELDQTSHLKVLQLMDQAEPLV